MKRVLIIDDEIDLCSLVKSYLTRKNYEVITAHTLSDGIEKLERFNPDVLLLDNNLPDGMGWKIADLLHERFPEMNITLLSAYQQSWEQQVVEEPIHMLEKPISLVDIEKYL